MIKVTKLDDSEIVINAELIESVEEAPDTIITTTTRKRYMVKETAAQVIDSIMKYRMFIISGSEKLLSNPSDEFERDI